MRFNWRGWRLWANVAFPVLIALIALFPMLAAAQDSTQVATTGQTVSGLGTALVAIGGMLLTQVFGTAASAVNRVIGSADQTIKTKAGPLLPVIALASAIGLAKLNIAVDPGTVVNAPLAALSAVILNEAIKKWVLPFFGTITKR